ncbi:N(4)-(beta-N-acetylglucosaminyl)-L-asparaginase [Lactovum odontotermitis]
MWAIIGTWEMALDGISSASRILAQSGHAGDALEAAISNVENNPAYSSVGFGGLPNEKGTLEMDAAFMNGDTFQIGAVAGITDIKNPIKVARKLSLEKFNSFRVGPGATSYAIEEKFEQQNMLTKEAVSAWKTRVAAVANHQLQAYDGHDTVGVISLDSFGSMTAGTSTSGLFMKKPGRVGDSPLPGSGFYADSSYGGAAATGLGEDLMKGILSYEIVRQMKEGLTPQQACDAAVYGFEGQLKSRAGKAGAFSVIALNPQGEWGVATNVEFPFCLATQLQEASVYVARPGKDGHTLISQR